VRAVVGQQNAVELMAADMAGIGMPQKRKETLRHIARQVASGSLRLDTAHFKRLKHSLPIILQANTNLRR
jgi:3-methyladenine DNA glycosylase/8-oxoguanine DNA glycosylase